MSNYKGSPWAPIELQVDMMKSHTVRPAVRDPKRDSDQHTFLLARPPAWSEGVPCIGNYARFDDSVGLNAGEAAARCAGCPVIEQCLAAALEEERGLSAGSRYLIRGGKSPKERAAIEFSARTCKKGHRDRWSLLNNETVCLDCKAEDSRKKYRERLESDPDFRKRKSERQRANRARKRQEEAA